MSVFNLRLIQPYLVPPKTSSIVSLVPNAINSILGKQRKKELSDLHNTEVMSITFKNIRKLAKE